MARASAEDVREAKETALLAIANGATVVEAMRVAGRAAKTFEQWRAKDKDFARRVDEVRAARKARPAPPARLNPKASAIHPELRPRRPDTPVRRDWPFAEFRREFLGFETYPHQEAMIAAIEGREDVPLQDGYHWSRANPKRVLINLPVFHAKTQTLVDYMTWAICMNPDVRIAIVSKRMEMSKKILYQVKQRLTSNLFAKLQAAFAPEGGFKPQNGDGSFTQNLFYIAGRTLDQKDPTVEAIGLGGQIYGGRFDLIVLDDCVVLSNANEYEKQITWLESEVESRVKEGTIVILGTRLAQADLYMKLQEGERYLSGSTPWSYLKMPMVLKFADDPKDWVTLWPVTNVSPDAASVPRDDGLYTMWDGPTAAKIRDSKPPSVWSLVYQQESTDPDSIFQPDVVWGSVDRRRKAGPLTAGAWGHPEHGKEGMYTIAAMDPAMTGQTAIVVGCVDRGAGKRWIENAWTNPGSVQYIRQMIKQVTDEYHVNEWVIETNAFQGFLVEDPELRNFLAQRGVRMSGHYTGRNKQDPDLGVASLGPLFGSTRRINDGAGRAVHNKDNLIELPDPESSPGVKALIEQLLTWVPGKRGKDHLMDMVMGLWFYDLRVRNILGFGEGQRQQQTHVQSKFRSRRRSKRQGVTPAHVLEGRGF